MKRISKRIESQKVTVYMLKWGKKIVWRGGLANFRNS